MGSSLYTPLYKESILIDMLAPLMDSELRFLRKKVEEALARYKRVRLVNRPSWFELREIRRSSSIASDSSFLGVLTRYAFVYVIRAFSAPFTGSSEDVIRYGRYLARFDAMELLSSLDDEDSSPYPYRDRRGVVHHIAKDLEVASVKAVSDSIRSPPDLVLFDGSLRSFFYNRFRGGDPFSESLRRSWVERVETLKKLSEVSRVVFVSKVHTRQVLSRFLRPEIDGEPVIVPDYALVDKIFEDRPRVPGFLEPIEISENETGIRYTLTYAILAKGAPAYQVTMPGSISTEEVSEILEMVRFHSASGYPEPLRQCHYHSKIGRREFLQLLGAYGVRLESGREVLGEL
ncbi:MAG: DNA double-strand break repair nuclease NurA [Desulfurococcales archaeon]|nr:DNA double-strand break repair nuclease NurA [Desulfurococcales archaeon]